MTRLTLQVCLLACLWGSAVVPSQAQTTLYDRLGGDAGVHAIADALIDRVAGDAVLGRSFQCTNLELNKLLLAEQI